ncbi:hypothetical protein SNEBB_000121 [Seison nebaliae]|nr:hypothetical protein SNEBB_000121 [Seison nebaliae]
MEFSKNKVVNYNSQFKWIQDIDFTSKNFNSKILLKEFVEQNNVKYLFYLQNNLGEFVDVIRKEMVNIVDRDYEDFVTLSTNLKQLELSIDSYLLPLSKEKEELSNIYEIWQNLMSEIDAKEKRFTKINIEIELIGCLMNSNEIIEDLTKKFEIDDLTQLTTSQLELMFQQLKISEDQLFFIREHTSSSKYKDDVDGLDKRHRLLKNQLSEILVKFLEKHFRSNSNLSDVHRLITTSFFLYSIDDVYEKIVKKCFMNKMIEDVANKSTDKHEEDLKEFYANFLLLNTDRRYLVLKKAFDEHQLSFDNSPEFFSEKTLEIFFNFLKNSHEKWISSAASDTSLFALRYLQTEIFQEQIHKIVPESQVNFFPLFYDKLATYYELSFFNLIKQIEKEMMNYNNDNNCFIQNILEVSKKVLKEIWTLNKIEKNSDVDDDDEDGIKKNNVIDIFHQNPRIVIKPLFHQFIRLTFQIIVRLKTFFLNLKLDEDIYLKFQHIYSGYSSFSDTLSSLLENEIAEHVKLYFHPNDSSTKFSCIKEGINEEMKLFYDSVIENRLKNEAILLLTNNFSKIIKKGINDIPRQYRRMNRPKPTNKSEYLSSVFDDIDQFMEKDEKDILRKELVTECKSIYKNRLVDMLEMLKQMEENLKRLKESRRQLNRDEDINSSSEKMNDDDKIRLQINIDTKFIVEKLSSYSQGMDLGFQDDVIVVKSINYNKLNKCKLFKIEATNKKSTFLEISLKRLN